MRLTADLINNSLSYLNPLKERELDLRGMSQSLERADATLFDPLPQQERLPEK
jgi:hypothetical protein